MGNSNNQGGMKAAAAKAEAEKKAAEEKAAAEAQQPTETEAPQEPAAAITEPAGGAEDFQGLTQEELVQRLKDMQSKNDQLEKDNKDLRETAIDNATRMSQLREMELKPTTDASLLWDTQLKSNPREFVRAGNSGEAQRVYMDFYGITASEHAFSIAPAESVPDGFQEIHVDESGNVCRKADAEPVEA